MPKIDKPLPPRSNPAAARELIAHRLNDPAVRGKRAELLTNKAALRAIEDKLHRLALRRMAHGRLNPTQVLTVAKLRRDLDSLADKIYDARAAMRASAPTKARQGGK